MGVWYGLWWVWLERCKDGRYVVFGEVFFAGSASLHDCFFFALFGKLYKQFGPNQLPPP